MKRLAFSLILLLGFSALAQPSVLPADERFDLPVSLQFDDSLASVVEALARSVGLQPVLSQVPDTPVYYNISEPTSFRTVWHTVLTLNDLDFLLRDEDIVVVGPAAEVQKLRDVDLATIQTADAAEAGTIVQEFYSVASDAAGMAELLRSAIPGLYVEVLPTVNTLLVRASASQHVQVQQYLARFDQVPEQVMVEFRTYRLSNAQAAELAGVLSGAQGALFQAASEDEADGEELAGAETGNLFNVTAEDRKSTRLNSSHVAISYAVFCLKKKKTTRENYSTSMSTHG